MDQGKPQQEGSGLGGLAGGVAQFMAYSYMYNQLDNVWSGSLNSALHGNQMSIRLPWLKAMGRGKEVKGFAGFTTNIHGAMDKSPVSKSQVMQLLSRGDKTSIDILRTAGIDEKILESFGKNQSTTILGKAKHYLSRTDRNIGEKILDVNSGRVNAFGVAEQLGDTKKMNKIINKMASKAGVAAEELDTALLKGANSIRKHVLQPDAKNGMGFIINASIKNTLLGSLFRLPMGLAAAWASPTYQMIIKPIENLVTDQIKKEIVGERVNDYKTGYIHSQVSMVSQENQASLQMGESAIYSNTQMTAGILAAGKQANRYLDQLMKQRQQAPLQPAQQRKSRR